MRDRRDGEQRRLSFMLEWNYYWISQQIKVAQGEVLTVQIVVTILAMMSPQHPQGDDVVRREAASFSSRSLPAVTGRATGAAHPNGRFHKRLSLQQRRSNVCLS